MRIPSIVSRAGSPGPFGQMTLTSYPARRRAWHSSQTRRSNGTGRFWTMISTCGCGCMRQAFRTGAPRQPRERPFPHFREALRPLVEEVASDHLDTPWRRQGFETGLRASSTSDVSRWLRRAARPVSKPPGPRRAGLGARRCATSAARLATVANASPVTSSSSTVMPKCSSSVTTSSTIASESSSGSSPSSTVSGPIVAAWSSSPSVRTRTSITPSTTRFGGGRHL